jgi:hypothetical protein
VNGKEILSMTDIVRIGGCKIAFAKGKVVDGVQEVGLPRTIVPHKAIDLVGELEYRFFVVFEIGKGKFADVHDLSD